QRAAEPRECPRYRQVSAGRTRCSDCRAGADFGRVISSAVPYRYVVPAPNLDSNGPVSSIGERVRRIVAGPIDMAQLLSDLASQPGSIGQSVGVINRSAAGLGDISHEIPAMVPARARVAPPLASAGRRPWVNRRIHRIEVGPRERKRNSGPWYWKWQPVPRV